MKKSLGWISMLAIWMSGSVWGDTQLSTSTWQGVLNALEDSEIAPEETLVLFDVNDVLLAPDDAILSKPYRQKAMQKIRKMHQLDQVSHVEGVHPVLQDDPQVTETFMDIWVKSHIDVVDQEGPRAIERIQALGYHALGLTNGITGKIGDVSDMVEYRTEELYRLGYHFKSSIGQNGLRLGEEPLVGNGAPVYQDGIIYTSGLPKGPILGVFLRSLSFSPKRIVFVDDKKGNLASVAAFCHQYGIEFLGIHFKAIDVKTQDQEWEERVSNCQFDYYEKFHQWLPDAEVRKSRCYIEDRHM